MMFDSLSFCKYFYFCKNAYVYLSCFKGQSASFLQEKNLERELRPNQGLILNIHDSLSNFLCKSSPKGNSSFPHL